VILGPTAVGKTNIAIKVAHQLNGEIISADSMQVYRHLNIGTAKPSLTERKRVPHHLMDIVDPGENYNVVRFQSEVKQLIPAIVGRGHLPMLVGGTGLYISAVVDNYNFSHDGPNPLLRRQLTARAVKLGSQTLHRELSQVDPAAAKKIQRTDTRRLVRALEVSASGQQFSASKHGPPLYRVVQIGLTRKRTKLYEAVNQRVEQMFDRGLVEEANWILQLDLPPDLPVLQALGYKEIFPYLQGEVSIDEAKDNLKRQTRRFVKRQLTWFRRDERIIWLDRDEYSDQEALTAQIVSIVEGKL
ncbi:MAG TPA: tRNA (adenosine(37)-N6)-dimethylallyltransferase MiaA, partial [Firmicutes bacterium]|nr:tRNA (adenosine(37)-N6)-dimethylallyltransferase MiaA [Bacillota bacterium]